MNKEFRFIHVEDPAPALAGPEITVNPKNFAVRAVPIDLFAIPNDDYPHQSFFTPDELKAVKNPQQLAARFAAKSCLISTLGFPPNLTDIEILKEESGKPVCRLKGDAKNYAQRVKISGCSVSLSHDADTALAFVYAQPINFPQLQIGTDVISIQRMQEALSLHEPKFLDRIFTEAEAEECRNNPELLAQRWTGKEATVKALETGFWRQGVNLRDVEIVSGDHEVLTVRLYKGAAARAQEFSIVRWRIIAPVYGPFVAAFAVAQVRK